MADRGAEIRETFERIHRPLQWPMEAFRRRRISGRAFVGYRFSRARRRAAAGFAFGFLLADGDVARHVDPPEAVAYAFVRPVGSALHEELVRRRGSAVRRLVATAAEEGLPFVLDPTADIAAIRRRSLRRMPPELFALAASDFFMATYGPLRASGFLERLEKATTRPGP